MAREELPFSRDFGYLDRFLATLRAHAAGLPEARRSELLQFVTAEAGRWDRIKALLAGPDSGTGAPREATDPRPGAAARGLTVGSLMPDR